MSAHRLGSVTALVAVAGVALVTTAVHAQPRAGFGGPRSEPEIEGIPKEPTPVTLPTLSAPVTGPGPMFDSAPSQMRGLDPAHFHYKTTEYFVSGIADGKPYTTRVVVRQPAEDGKFSGLVLAESMHSSGAAHMFELTAAYLMSSGHAAVEILTTSPAQFVALNAKRYEKLSITDGQQNEIIAQVGALVRSDHGPLGKLHVRKMVMAGTSMSSGTLVNYLPAHMVFRTPDMQRIFDGFMPTSYGGTPRDVDVPLIEMPTMLEEESNVPRRQDSDEPGKQFRLYEVAGIGHVDSRDNVRLHPNPCVKPLSTVPNQAYFSVGLYHLLRWVDQGIAPPRAPRILLDRDASNDGSMMILDANGNPLGGIRTPYVDVPTAKYSASNTAATPLIANPSAYVAANGIPGAQIMCRLSAYQEPYSKEKLKELYGTKRDYVRKVEARLLDLEKQSWSLPVYHDVIMGDAAAIDF
jgi:hypothetical protein